MSPLALDSTILFTADVSEIVAGLQKTEQKRLQNPSESPKWLICQSLDA